MTKYIFHTIGHNERFDNIAYKYYSNCYNIAPIIEANPHIPICAILPEGQVLKIPINDDNNQIDKSLLPVWKQ